MRSCVRPRDAGRRLDRGQDRLLDVLSSDYVPLSLIQAAFALPEIAEGVGLADAVKLVTKTPAEAVGLDDRGDFFDIPPGHDAYVDGPDRVELVLFEPPAHDH